MKCKCKQKSITYPEKKKIPINLCNIKENPNFLMELFNMYNVHNVYLPVL